MKKLNHILNAIIGSFVGVFIGHGIYVVWNFKTYPELYAAYSAPWYTSIFLLAFRDVSDYTDKKYGVYLVDGLL